MNFDDYLAKCPICEGLLGLDQMGCPTCWQCAKEYKGKYGYTMERTEKFVDEVAMKIMDMDLEILIIEKSKLEELNVLIQSSTPKLEEP